MKTTQVLKYLTGSALLAMDLSLAITSIVDHDAMDRAWVPVVIFFSVYLFAAAALCTRKDLQRKPTTILIVLGFAVTQLGCLVGLRQDHEPTRVDWFLVQTLLVIGAICCCGAVMYWDHDSWHLWVVKWLMSISIALGAIGQGFLFLSAHHARIGKIFLSTRVVVMLFCFLVIIFRKL